MSILVRQKSRFENKPTFIVFSGLPHNLANRVPPNLVNTPIPLDPLKS